MSWVYMRLSKAMEALKSSVNLSVCLVNRPLHSFIFTPQCLLISNQFFVTFIICFSAFKCILAAKLFYKAVNDLQELLPIFPQFILPHSRNREHVLLVAGQAIAHLVQGAVVEDNIRGHSFPGRDFLATGSQQLKN